MNPEFTSHQLTESGVVKAKAIASLFNDLLGELAIYCPPGREFSICRTKLEEACFFAKKSMAKDNAQ